MFRDLVIQSEHLVKKALRRKAFRVRYKSIAAFLCQIEVLELHPKGIQQNSSLQFHFHFYRVPDLPLHSLHSVKGLLVNNRLMSILYQVHFLLTGVLHLFPRQKIRRIGLLHQHLAHIFFIAQHPVYGGGAPLRLSGNRLDAVGFQILFDLPHSVSLNIEIKNLSDDLGLLRYDLQHSIRPLGIAQKLPVIQNGFSAPHSILNAGFDALAAGLALRLRKGGISSEGLDTLQKNYNIKVIYRFYIKVWSRQSVQELH